MTYVEASLIKALRDCGCTWRKIAEVWSEATNETDSTQQRGQELCAEAAQVLGLESLDD